MSYKVLSPSHVYEVAPDLSVDRAVGSLLLAERNLTTQITTEISRFDLSPNELVTDGVLYYLGIQDTIARFEGTSATLAHFPTHFVFMVENSEVVACLPPLPYSILMRYVPWPGKTGGAPILVGTFFTTCPLALNERQSRSYLDVLDFEYGSDDTTFPLESATVEAQNALELMDYGHPSVLVDRTPRIILR